MDAVWTVSSLLLLGVSVDDSERYLVRGDSHRLPLSSLTVFTGPAHVSSHQSISLSFEIIRVSVYRQNTHHVGHSEELVTRVCLRVGENAFRPQGSLPPFTVTPLSARSLTNRPGGLFFSACCLAWRDNACVVYDPELGR